MTKYPVQYPTACSPQAWSTGTPLLLLRTMLGLEPLGDHLVVDPALPQGIGHVELLDIPGRWGRMDASDVAAWTSRQGRKGASRACRGLWLVGDMQSALSVVTEQWAGCGYLASIRRRAFPLCRVMSGMGAGASRPGWRSAHQPSPLPTGYAHARDRHSFLHARPGSSSRCAQRRVDEARAPFERLLGLTNDLGPLAAEYNAKRQVGTGSPPTPSWGRRWLSRQRRRPRNGGAA